MVVSDCRSDAVLKGHKAAEVDGMGVRPYHLVGKFSFTVLALYAAGLKRACP